MRHNNIDTLIFDLGGVILDLDLDGAFQRFSTLMEGEIKDLHHAYTAFPFIMQYEIGAMDSPAFIKSFQGVFKQKIDSDAFRRLWHSMLVGIPEERIRWIRELGNRYRLVLLSNTNALHIERVEEILLRDTGVGSLEEVFDKTYYSHTINKRKPDMECFTFVMDDLGTIPGSCVFFDDNRENIAAAEAMGMKGVLVPFNSFSRHHLSHVE